MSMPFTPLIEDEARILSSHEDDLDNFRRAYTYKEETNGETFNIRFVAPQISLFEEYRFYLYQNSVYKKLKQSRYYRPDYVSYDEYGTINLWALLLFINDIPTIEDFAVNKILIPSSLAISTMASDMSRKPPSKQLVQLKDLSLKPTAPLYSISKIVPNQSLYIPEPTITGQSDVYFCRELFSIDITQLRHRYIDLQYEPIENTVNLLIKDHSNYIYGKHYKMIRGTNGMNRLTWDPKNISSGIGLVGTMVEKLNIEITYVRRLIV